MEGRWRIKEFHLPIHGWRFLRTEAGRWICFDMFGDVVDRNRYSGHPVSGKIILGGKPPSKGSIEFLHVADVKFFGIGHIRDGTYHADLPPDSNVRRSHRPTHRSVRSFRAEVVPTDASNP